MFIRLQGYEIEAAITEYIKREMKVKGEVAYCEITTEKMIKKDIPLNNDSTEFEVFIEIRDED